MVEGIKEKLFPFISKINYAQEMYEALLKLFTIKNISQVATLKNEPRTTNMTKQDKLASLFAKIIKIKDEILGIDEIVLDK